MRKHPVEPRYTVSFDDGAHVTQNPLPHSRALRIALRGVGEHGKYKTAEILDSNGEVLETVVALPAVEPVPVVEVTEAEAQQIRDGFFEAYPKLADW